MQSGYKKQGHNFDLSDVCDFFPKYIPYASFNNITIPNEVHMFDIMPMPPDKYMRRIFKYWFVVKDAASRYRRSLALTDKLSTHTAKAFETLYCPLTWLKLLIIDRGKEYMC
ncbi:unnamed protein product [Rhizophagus irregularis]|nr:unnamed protein product [Rhizophagus irregularis]